jgi:hypothetical protein
MEGRLAEMVEVEMGRDLRVLICVVLKLGLFMYLCWLDFFALFIYERSMMELSLIHVRRQNFGSQNLGARVSVEALSLDRSVSPLHGRLAELRLDLEPAQRDSVAGFAVSLGVEFD